MVNFAPLISIIVPVYNVEQYLERCVDSLIGQTFHNIEIILVDDGSPDNSGVICDDYAVRDNRIKVIHQKNAGVTEARIAGFELSSGEYISFVDSDDYISSDYIEYLYGLINKFHVELACCHYYNVYGEKIVPECRESVGYFDRKGIETLLSKNFLYDYKQKRAAFFPGQCCKMMARKWVSASLYKSRGLKWGEDITMLIDVLYHISSFYVSSEQKYYYVQHQGQTTRSADINTWNNLVEHWRTIIRLDVNHYMTSQLAYRILRYIQVFMKNNLALAVSYVDFKRKVDLALENEVVRELFVNYPYKNLTLIDRLFVLFTKQKQYWFFYLAGKMAIPIKNCIKNNKV